MPVQRQKEQQADKPKKIRHYRHFKPVLGIEKAGKTETHLHADKIAGERHGGEGQLHRKAEGEPDRNLLEDKDNCRDRERQRGRVLDYRGENGCDNKGERHFHPRWNSRRAETGRRCKECERP